MKNFWLMTITSAARRSSYNPIATWFPSRNEGSGQFHSMCPIETYISGTRRITDATSRRFIFGVSVSFSESESFFVFPLFDFDEEFLRLAPYPAFSTAFTISSAEAVPSTPSEFVRRLTAQLFTPGTALTAFSTRVWQAAQLIPVTLYCSIRQSLRFFSFTHTP